ncbi:NAD(P)/FAD-dependent oxidoreductase [Nocardioides sp.]|uniref:NAD(P)/FAD-dependent oxidoreductase n=1 Tax=Nocardioides sp. TaxID=35761 RepID=UPI002D0D2CE8|nr:FAD-dependent oxidoreductase [Nocardioides sp.]HXH77019.1 FAD-dependent oxidoreductase [Nocardioides sp.]
MSPRENGDQVVVVGAGISGVACARELRAAGMGVRVLDRGHHPGGRMASKQWSGRAVDLGASYLTAAHPEFRAVVEDWRERGLAREWTDTFGALEGGTWTAKQGPMRWGTPAGMRSLVVDLAAGLDVQRHEVVALAELKGLSAAAVVLAMPDPQAMRLIDPDHPMAAHLDREFEPVIALAARWGERAWDDVSATGRFDGGFVNTDRVLGWVADDGRRRGDDAPVLVAHSTPDFARQHLDDPEAAGPEMVRALREVMGLSEPVEVHVHRWSLARPVGEREAAYALETGPQGLLGVCGDGWGLSPKVETAWRSGRDLGRALAERLS